MTIQSTINVREGLTVSRQGTSLRVDVLKVDHTVIDFSLDNLAIILRGPIAQGAHFIIDRNVCMLYGLDARLNPSEYTLFDASEQNKTLDSVYALATQLYAKNVHRRMTLVGIGGGVTTDTVGLLATLYFRGVRVAYVPTTLLAMIDAAIGGKVGVNHERQKNLLGHFYHPAHVTIPVSTLRTLPREEITAAFGEILKIAVIGSELLFEILESITRLDDVDDDLYMHMIRLCVEGKLEMLGANCFERELDRILNFGHTVAHPLEDITHFRIKHGAAVGMGIAVASHIAMQRGLLDPQDFRRIITVMQRLGMPVMDRNFDRAELWEHVSRLVMQRGGHSLYYAIPVKIGQATIIDSITQHELNDAITHLLESAE